MTLKLIVSIPTFCLVAALREMRAASAAEETVSLTTISMPILYTGDAHSDTSDHTDKLILQSQIKMICRQSCWVSVRYEQIYLGFYKKILRYSEINECRVILNKLRRKYFWVPTPCSVWWVRSVCLCSSTSSLLDTPRPTASHRSSLVSPCWVAPSPAFHTFLAAGQQDSRTALAAEVVLDVPH